MTRDEVMAMSDEELLACLRKILGRFDDEIIPDYLNDIAAVWELPPRRRRP